MDAGQVKTCVTACAGRLPERVNPSRRRTPFSLGNNCFPESSSGQGYGCHEWGGHLASPPYSWLWRFTGHKWAVSLGNGLGCCPRREWPPGPRKGRPKVPLQSSAAWRPSADGQGVREPRRTSVPSRVWAARDGGPEPSPQVWAPGCPGESRERRLGQC